MRRAVRCWAALVLGGAWWPGGPAGAATLRGRVVAADGTPAAGAAVWAILNRPLGIAPPDRPAARRDGVADAEGRFAFEVDGGFWRCNAILGDQGSEDDPGYVGVWVGDPRPTTVRLQPPSRLRARLVAAEDGRPIAGCRLGLADGRVVVADAQGRLEVPGLGRMYPQELIPLAPGRERRPFRCVMAAGPTTDLDLAVPRGEQVVGRVLDVDGKPVAGATVGLSGRPDGADDVHFRVETDERGRFEYDGLPIDQASTLRAAAAGHLDDARPVDPHPGPDGAPPRVDFRLARLAASPPPPPPAGGPRPAPGAPPFRIVTGAVRDEAGRPVAATASPNMESLVGHGEARTDAAGRFRLVVEYNLTSVVAIIPDRPDLGPKRVAIAAEGDQDLAVVVAPGRAVDGVVRDDRGAPLAGVVVVPHFEGVARLVERAATTDARGHFHAAGLPDSPVALSLSGDGMVRRTVPAAEVAATNELTMAPRGVLAGRVVDAEGRPVRDFRVLVHQPRDRRSDDPLGYNFTIFGFKTPGMTFTAPDGTFRIPAGHPGEYHRITVLAPGHGEGVVDRCVAIPSNGATPDRLVTIRLPPPHRLRVHVVAGGTRRPIADARVALIGSAAFNGNFEWRRDSDTEYDMIHARADGTGTATFDPLGYAEGIVLVEGPGLGRRFVRWRDEAPDLSVPVDPEGVIEGTVLDEAVGEPHNGSYVEVASPENGVLYVWRQDGDGSPFRFAELPGGEYKLSVQTKFGTDYSERIVLKSGEHATRTIRLKLRPPSPR